MIRVDDEPVIYLITKGEARPENFQQTSREILDIVRAAVDERVSLIQIREKQLGGKLLFELATEAARITIGSSTRLLVNDRADVAAAAKADGVHLASNSLPVSVVRASFGRDLIIGVSTHSIEDVRLAAEQGADFAVFGPVFETPAKGESQGLTKLAEVCRASPGFPVLGLGGIDETNYASVLDAGASGFAAIRALNDPGRLSTICRDLRK